MLNLLLHLPKWHEVTCLCNVRPGDMRPMDGSAIAQVLATFGTQRRSKRDDVQLPIYSSGVTDPHVASLAMPRSDSNVAMICGRASATRVRTSECIRL